MPKLFKVLKPNLRQNCSQQPLANSCFMFYALSPIYLFTYVYLCKHLVLHFFSCYAFTGISNVFYITTVCTSFYLCQAHWVAVLRMKWAKNNKMTWLDHRLESVACITSLMYSRALCFKLFFWGTYFSCTEWPSHSVTVSHCKWNWLTNPGWRGATGHWWQKNHGGSTLALELHVSFVRTGRERGPRASWQRLSRTMLEAISSL